MKKTLFLILVTSIAAQTAFGDLTNTRQFGSEPSLTELQGVFSGIGSTINAYGDQSPYGYFEPTGAGNATAAYIATVSWAWPVLEFGIYELGDPTNKLTLFNQTTVIADPFSGTVPPGASVLIDFDEGGDTVTAKDLDNLVIVDQTTYFKNFGFYAITTIDTNPLAQIGPFYSEDELNEGGYARFLTYEAKGDPVTIGDKGTYNDIDHWYVAAEAGLYDDGNTTDGDFTDFVVQLESVAPVPVPAAVLLGFLGLGAAGLKLRRFA